MNKYTIYFAGDLFDHKHLIGNRLLSDEIKKLSGGKFEPTLPQDHEQSSSRSTDIRDSDYELLINSDLALFNFDGTDLDSGTVAEFMIAKMLDIPSVIIRSDFRLAGDQKLDGGDNWNLMLSGYPRTINLNFNSMYQYQARRYLRSEDLIKSLYSTYADSIIKAFENVLKVEPLFDVYNLTVIYPNTIKGIGQSLVKKLDATAILDILKSKLEKPGLIGANNV